jgi:hypothetical protein
MPGQGPMAWSVYLDLLVAESQIVLPDDERLSVTRKLAFDVPRVS